MTNISSSDDVIVDLNVDIKPSFNEDFKLEVECIDSFNENGSRSKVRAMTTMRGNRLVAAKKLDLVELCPDNGNTFEDTCSVKLTVSYFKNKYLIRLLIEIKLNSLAVTCSKHLNTSVNHMRSAVKLNCNGNLVQTSTFVTLSSSARLTMTCRSRGFT